MSYTPPHHRRISHVETKQRETQETRDMRNNAMRRIFGPTIKSFEFPDDVRASNVFNGLLSHIFDAGTNRNVSCEVATKEGMIQLSEAAIPIHSRSSLITHSMEEIRAGKHVEFGMIDLQNFRNADFDLGERDKGVHSADIIINKSARAIRSALREVWLEQGYMYDTNSYELGRYGGDEFVIALFGDKAIGAKEMIMKRVQEKLGCETGLYKQDGEIKNLPIQLKKIDEAGNIVEWLRPPQTGAEREIYLDFFQRGTLFNETEFNRILVKYSPHGKLDMDLYKRDYPTTAGDISYPEGVGDDLEKKIAYITKNHPELAVPFGLAAAYDKKTPIVSPNGLSRRENLLHIVEHSIFDRLLGDMIYSKSHFSEHMKRGEIGQLYILDFKFLKEINTGMTYADADMQIKKLWERIKETLTEEDRKKVIVSRFAGAFYIGVRKGERLTTGGALRDIRTLTLFDDDGEETGPVVPIGYERHVVHPHEYKEHYRAINKAESESDAHFYTHLVKDIVDSSVDDPAFLDDMLRVDVDKIGTGKEYHPLSKAELYSLLLKGKRKEARIQKVKENIQKGATLAGSAYLEGKKTSPGEIQRYLQRVRNVRQILWADLEKCRAKLQ